MKEELTTQETSLLAKSKGFNEVTEIFFDWAYPNGVINLNSLTNFDKNIGERDICCWCTQSLLQRWLREKHNIHVAVVPDKYKFGTYNIEVVYKADDINVIYGQKSFNSYETALEDGLRIGLEVVGICLTYETNKETPN